MLLRLPESHAAIVDAGEPSVVTPECDRTPRDSFARGPDAGDRALKLTRCDIIDIGGHKITQFHVSDGKTMWLSLPGGILREELSENSIESLHSKYAFARAGITLSSVMRNRDHERAHTPTETRYLMRSPKLGEEDSGLRSITYDLKIKAHNRVYEMTLWYKSADYRIVKRRILVKEPGFEESFTETYDEFILNADIPDGKFKLPE